MDEACYAVFRVGSTFFRLMRSFPRLSTLVSRQLGEMQWIRATEFRAVKHFAEMPTTSRLHLSPSLSSSPVAQRNECFPAESTFLSLQMALLLLTGHPRSSLQVELISISKFQQPPAVPPRCRRLSAHLHGSKRPRAPNLLRYTPVPNLRHACHYQ